MNYTDPSSRNLLNMCTWHEKIVLRATAPSFSGLGCVVLVVGYCQVTFWSLAAYRQGQRIRTLLFRCILKQEIGWFDLHESGELNNRLAE